MNGYTQSTRNKRKTSTDRRVVRTKLQLRQTLTELMQEKRVKDITVRELTNRADVSRGTFYLHYDDVIELLENIKDETFVQLKDAVDAIPDVDVEGRALPVFVEIYKFFLENEDLGSLLFTGDYSDEFAERLEQLMFEKCFSSMPATSQRDDESEINYRYRVSFAIVGCIGIFKTWMKNGMRESPLRMALVTEDAMLNGFNSKKQ